MADDQSKSPSLGNIAPAVDPDDETSSKRNVVDVETKPKIDDDPQPPKVQKDADTIVDNKDKPEVGDGSEKSSKIEDSGKNDDDTTVNEVIGQSTRRASNDVQENSSPSVLPSSEKNSPEIPDKTQTPRRDSTKNVDRVVDNPNDEKNNSDVSKRIAVGESRSECSTRGTTSAICNTEESFEDKRVEATTPMNDEKRNEISATTSGRAETVAGSKPEVVNEEDDDADDDDDDDEDGNAGDDDGEVVDDEGDETEEECRVNDVSEVGIVGPPTAVRDIVNDEELGTTESSSLPNDGRNDATTGNGAPDVADWVEKSRRSNGTGESENPKNSEKSGRTRKKSCTDATATSGMVATRQSQKIITSIIRRSIKCLNKMHAAVEYGSGGTSGKKIEANEKREEDARGSPKVPQSRQNGAALPEETATAMATSDASAERLCPVVKRENLSDAENEQQSMTIDGERSRRRSVEEVVAAAAAAVGSRNSGKAKSGNAGPVRIPKTEREQTRKRRSTDDSFAANCNPSSKKICFEQRERFIDSLVGNSERVTAEELATRADELRAEVQALDEMARAKEMEWNEILSMRKLKEEAYLRIERRRQVVGFMESNGQLSENLPPASLSLIPDWETITAGNTGRSASTVESPLPRENKDSGEARLLETQESQRSEEICREAASPVPTRREKSVVSLKTSNHGQRRTASPKQISENGRKQQQRHNQQLQQQTQMQQQQQQKPKQQQPQRQHVVEPQSIENRQIGEGRQGPIVDVRSIIADYRLRHPETVPRRGRRMRNSVNIGLGAGGAMVETGHNVDSRPSSTDSSKSNPNPSGDPNNPMSFKDVLVQFAKLSQQQGEPVKTPQNYPDVTLHPVAPTPIVQNSTSQQQNTGSLLHGILTKSQSPRPTTFSPTLARLLTAPERERNSAPITNSNSQQNTQTQHLLQTYQGSNPVSITDLLSSSKARTEITITPVVNPVAPIHTSHSINLVHVDDVEEESSLIDERDSRINSGARDNRDERDNPPRCQGCQERAAQFVCAGCGNQWYCSRDCQVAAWDEHSEVCSG